MLKENLVHLRKQNGLTQDELAKRLKVSRSVIAKWESGRGLPRIGNLLELSHLFNINMESILQ